MQILASIIISAIMVLGSVAYTHETKAPALGASQTISSLTAGSSLDDTDVLPYTETSSLTTKKITWGNATSTLKTYYDTVYSPIFSTSAGFFGLISDETGSAGGVVRATSPTLTTPTITSPTINTSFLGNAVLGISQGGTGSTTKNDALNALLPTQTGNSGKYAQTDGTNFSWVTVAVPSGTGASSTVAINNGSNDVRWYDGGYATPYNATISMSTSSANKPLAQGGTSWAPSQIASTSPSSSGANCTNAVLARISSVTVWKHGRVLAEASAQSVSADSFNLLLSKNGLSTTTVSAPATAGTYHAGAVFDVVAGDELSFYCDETGADSANPTSYSFRLYATTTNGAPTISY